MPRIAFLFLCLNYTVSFAQCNGATNLCSKRYDQVAYLTTHNAFNADDQGFTFPNQNVGITAQLDLGVRGLMLDVYEMNGIPTVYHGFSVLGNVPLVSNLEEIRVFLENNPNDIVTIIFECYVDANMIEAAMNTAGLAIYLYAKPAGQDWDILGDMIAANKRLVVFTDVDDASLGQEWYHYVWDYAVETHYSVNSNSAFTNDYNRGNPANDLFIFNHFVTSANYGVGLLMEAQIVNEFSFLMNRIQGHFNEYAKFPNFVTLDFVDVGNGKQVVDSLNSDAFGLEVKSLTKSTLRVSPNPALDYIEISGLNMQSKYDLEILDFKGRVKSSAHIESLESLIWELPRLPKSTCILRIIENGQINYLHRIVLQ